ncbi:hypothetical protein [Fusobacterium sp. oral taxon 370]|uniref:hypothetical protein n=1 Tax=Fusobacterium sp. oral taxon 370 TaxID=712288 RepID=UPI0002E83B24|nr:hypothetical protein [Fusobacterium sp. oral taxon 370]
MMKTYSISYKYSTNGGKSWISTTTSVKAESDMGAIAQINSKYPDVKDIRIISVR